MELKATAKIMFPADFINDLRDSLGAGRAERLLAALSADPEVSVRVNPDKLSLTALREHFAAPAGDPVPGVSVSFCTDESCVMCESDENGIISFRGAPDNYHVQLVDVPDGWIADGSSDFYTGYALTQWVLKLGREGGSR